jgi:hypothetical protein
MRVGPIFQARRQHKVRRSTFRSSTAGKVFDLAFFYETFCKVDTTGTR